ncbi:glycosyltransferase family 4 protein [Clostridium sp. D43t1_170807_H7]|uniref:glycosyltransferase family 4 protein n=1 Tax=Clostridium sp. D43t1_170807_H7 TaxID=2787140 RepID=UPI001897F4EA|nr:glycosyltransferase family 4 protein [Clostridium sp. D43t1_170807_H7]
MKIVLLAKFLRKDGASTHIYTLAKEFDNRGHDVHIISAGPTKDKNAIKLFNNSINKNVKHHKVIFPCYAKFNFINKVFQLIRYLCAIPQVLYILYKINPDIIHVHYPVTSYVAWIYCKLNNKKFITTYHITGIEKQILHKKANAAVAISKELEEELMLKWGYSKDEIYKVTNGVDDKRFNRDVSQLEKQRLKEEFNIPKDKIIIGFVGTYEHKKGIDILIKACSKIEKNKFHVVLVGDGDVNWVNSLINEFNIRDNITLKQFQDPVDFYSIFDIFVLPSTNEGFGLVAVEAMMQAIPVIRSNTGGAYDMIKHKIDGYIFENKNVDELRGYLEELIIDNKLRKKIGYNGKQRAINEFGKDKMIDKMLEVYTDVISK